MAHGSSFLFIDRSFLDDPKRAPERTCLSSTSADPKHPSQLSGMLLAFLIERLI